MLLGFLSLIFVLLMFVGSAIIPVLCIFALVKYLKGSPKVEEVAQPTSCGNCVCKKKKQDATKQILNEDIH